ncbi:acyltransferase [Calidifontibacter sp. DB0510]|uniref:Acyltransferase n=1 Tax=Metallococcus carri TaxID=1656884 RepID=A0A967AXS6_9MICO|nr:acyltransferase [Metallococcus carri]NHN54959.1 acyltransferase [Metallococcus carri]NOP37305.1 acyltransferase [Calidifontibacter sp. DB2511S]
MSARTQAAPRRPADRSAAIDGYRGFFVSLVVAFHFGATFLVGGWVGINHFFVFSGYLIARLLIHERVRTGRIAVLEFYRRRARRVLPAMLVLVTAVLLHTWLTQPPQQKSQFGGDALGTVGFYLNWRLISRQDAYFDMVGSPSPLRHAWTLSVEEQFYVLIPFLILGVCALTRRRSRRVLVVSAAAVAATWWTAHVGYRGLDSLPRVYYGTDTRLLALLVGVAAAFVFGRDDRGRFPRQLSRGTAQALGLIGFVVSLSALFVLSPTSAWAYNNGGMLLFAVAAALMGASATDRRDLPLNRIVGWAPLVFLGRISYGLYLYHWPIGLWLPLSGMPTVVAGTIQFALTVALAALSFRYLEAPILQHGLRAFVRTRLQGRVIAFGTVVAVAAAGFALWRTPQPGLADVPPLVAGQPAYIPRSGAPMRFGVVGDSVAVSLVKGYPPKAYRDLELNDFAAIGCDLMTQPLVVAGQQQPESQVCANWRKDWPVKFGQYFDRTLLLIAGTHYLTDHQTPSGPAAPGTPQAAALIRQSLTSIWQSANRNGARSVTVMNLPCRRIDPNKLDPSLRFFAAKGSNDAMVGWANGVIADWVKSTPRAHLLDLNAQLCGGGFTPTVRGIPLYHDTLHFTPEAAAMIWTWAAPAVRRNADG